VEISIYLFIYNVMLKLFKHLNSKDKGIGVVELIGDGIVSIIGLTNVAIGEFIIKRINKKTNTGEQGLVLNLYKNIISAVVLLRSNYAKVKEGQIVKRTFHVNKMYPVAAGADCEGIVLKLILHCLHLKNLVLEKKLRLGILG